MVEQCGSRNEAMHMPKYMYKSTKIFLSSDMEDEGYSKINGVLLDDLDKQRMK